MNYAVVFTYSFDDDVAVYLFDTEEKAVAFLRGSYEEEIRIDRKENEWETHGFTSGDGWYACIENWFPDRKDTTEMRIGRVYQ